MRSKISPFTFLGLAISLFGFIAVRFAFRAVGLSDSVATGVWKESVVWSLAALLLLLVRFGERLPLNSIGIGVAPWRQSLRYGCILTGLCGVTAWIVLSFTGYGHGPGSAEDNKIPIWFETLTVIRAGIVEELFFRGYAIERLQSLGCGRVLSAAIPLVVFAATHWTGGIENVILAFIGGIVLTLFYLWRRDLVANMIGHGLSDFLGLVLPRFFH
ncbi:MAG TPA: CPBP family intramembrane glutamic endopeptidase [Candidatus Udaeobacter sp.]|jgi:membrane protease YdiL (CAAX protease family)|nr:CPBP family intramembrane glutamic endopeptidase [Candidatus Udaeobacter sp.]